jgi:hypothetical protein
MSEQAIAEILTESAEQGIPETLDLWPAIRARVQTRPPHTLGPRAVRFAHLAAVSAGILLILGLALALSPDLRIAAAQGLQRILAAVRAQPDGSINLAPAPPFAVKLPKNLPQGFQLTASLYAPGTGIAVNDQAKRLPGLPEGAGAIAQQAWKRDWGSTPHLVLVYEAPGDLYVLVSERKANPNEALPAGEARAVGNQNATLRKMDRGLELTWLDEGTWVSIESNLPEDELLRLATTFVTSQAAASRSEPNLPAAPEAFNRLRELPFCDPSEQPPRDLLLGQVAGQSRKGSVRIELYDRPIYRENVTYGSDGQEPRTVLGDALIALRDSSHPLQRLPYGSISSFLKKDGEDCMRFDPQVEGYIVIELWDRQVNPGYGGAGAEMKERAIKAIENELKHMP